MKKLVIIPSDSLQDLRRCGLSDEWLEPYYNPGDFFDEVYSLYPHEKSETTGKIKYIKTDPNELMERIQEIKPDVIRGYGGGWASVYANRNRIKDIPIIISVHDVRPVFVDPSLRFADKIICVSEAVKRAVKRIARVDDSRIELLPNRVDTQKFFPKKDSSFAQQMKEKYGEGKFILHVGRKSPEKNLDTLIKAMNFLPPEYKVIFLGEGDSKIYADLARKEKVDDRCYFERGIPNQDLPYYYSWCDCMCTPSRSEGFGIVFIEAAACECSIVTSDIAPMNEFLKNGESATLVRNYLDPEALAHAILTATKKDVASERIKREARIAVMRFNKGNVDEQEVNIYKDVINRGANNMFLQQIEKEKSRNKKYIIFGTGKNGRAILPKILEKTAYFADNDSEKVGKTIDGVEVISYQRLLNIWKDYTVIFTTSGMDARNEIAEMFVRDGIDYISLSWFEAVNDLQLKEYELSLEFKRADQLNQ